MIRTTNKALAIVRLVNRKPGQFTYSEACAAVGARPEGYYYLVATGVIQFMARTKQSKKHPGRYSAVLKIGKVGKEKLAALRSGGSMPANV